MSTDYNRILCAVDLTDDSKPVAARAAAIASQWRAELRLLHVVEFVPIEPLSDSLVPVVQVDDSTIARALGQLQELAVAIGVDRNACEVVGGTVKAELLRHARDWQANLIVLGSRERHGLSILVNLTEDTVLHGACCDVLAVRVR
jgi:universal stress protein A